MVMEDERRLYPFRLCTLEDSYSWGSETWLLADLGFRDSLVRDGWLGANALSEVMETYLDRLVGENAFDWYGQQFPFQVKTLKVRGRMPLRVHPDDATASPRYDALGKEKFWYVTRAGRDACVLAGLKAACSAETFYLACSENRVEPLLNRIPVQAGNWLHIPPGGPHAALGDVDIVEVSESSGLDFWLCAWGEELSTQEFDPEMSLTDALDFIDLGPREIKVGTGTHCALHLPQFCVEFRSIAAPVRVSVAPADSCRAYLCLEGSLRVQPLQGDGPGAVGGSYEVPQGELLLVPAECGDHLLGSASGARVLDVYLERRAESDPYINPSAPARLPGDGEPGPEDLVS